MHWLVWHQYCWGSEFCSCCFGPGYGCRQARGAQHAALRPRFASPPPILVRRLRCRCSICSPLNSPLSNCSNGIIYDVRTLICCLHARALIACSALCMGLRATEPSASVRLHTSAQHGNIKGRGQARCKAEQGRTRAILCSHGGTPSTYALMSCGAATSASSSDNVRSGRMAGQARRGARG